MEHRADDVDSICYAMLYLKSELYTMGLEKSAALVGDTLDMIEQELSSSQIDTKDFRIYKDFIEKALKLDRETLSGLIAFLVADDKELAC
jgi:hypothetical protein